MSIDHATLADHVTELIEHGGYLERLTIALAEHGTVEHEGKGHRKIVGSPAPWNEQAASLLFEIHAATRRHERYARFIAGWPGRIRGGSDGQTRASLRNLPDLIELIRPRNPEAADEAAAHIAGWPKRCRALFDELREDEIEPTGAPGGLSCPYCAARLIIEPDFAMKANPLIWCPSKGCQVDGVNLSWPAGEWLGSLQELEDSPKPVREPYANQGSGRA